MLHKTYGRGLEPGLWGRQTRKKAIATIAVEIPNPKGLGGRRGAAASATRYVGSANRAALGLQHLQLL
jgi:hypothetical protein